ncbi:nucleoside deaminase [Arcanobacterium canis]
MYEIERVWMQEAMDLADSAGQVGDVPVGALVISPAGEVIGRGFNTRERDADPAGHAEINAMREAGRAIGGWNLSGYTLVVTLEPCTMCAGAIVNARMSRVVFGAWEEKAGAAGSIRDVLRDARLGTPIEVVGGIEQEEVRSQLAAWFVKLRHST